MVRSFHPISYRTSLREVLPEVPSGFFLNNSQVPDMPDPKDAEIIIGETLYSSRSTMAGLFMGMVA
jgi:hypothetical protein